MQLTFFYTDFRLFYAWFEGVLGQKSAVFSAFMPVSRDDIREKQVISKYRKISGNADKHYVFRDFAS